MCGGGKPGGSGCHQQQVEAGNAPNRQKRISGFHVILRLEADFQIDLAAGTCTCPAGQVTCTVRRAPSQSAPTGSLAAGRAHVPALCGFRPLSPPPLAVEHRLACLVQLGLRQSRYIGRHKTAAQLYLTATAVNLTRILAAN